MSTRREFLTVSPRRRRRRRPRSPARERRAQVDDGRPRELVHQGLRRLLREDALARVREAHRHQDQLRGGERGQHAHPAHHDRRDQVRPRDRRHRRQLALPVRRRVSSTSPTSPTEIGKKIGPLARQHPRRGGGQQEVEGAARGATSASSRSSAPTGSRRSASHKFPDTWEDLLDGRAPCSRRRAIPSASSSATASATTTAGSTRCCGRTAAARSTRTARPSLIDSDETAQGGRLLPQVLQGDDARGRAGLDRRQQQQGLPRRADLLHQQRRRPSCGRPSATSRTSPRSPTTALNPQGPKGRFHLLNPQSPRDLRPTPRTRRRPRPSCAGSTTTSSSSRWFDVAVTPTTRRSCTPTTTTDVERRAALPALPGVAQDLAAAGLAGAAQPRACRRAWPSTSSSTCSPRPAAATRPRTSSPRAAAQLKQIYKAK